MPQQEITSPTGNEMIQIAQNPDTGKSEFISTDSIAGLASSSGLEQITEGGNTGWRLVGRDPANYGDIGNNAVDLSYNNSASPNHGATGDYSFALGESSRAIGSRSVAFGQDTDATGTNSFAIGNNTNATNTASAAFGELSNASGANSVVFGYNNTSSGQGTFSSGSNNTSSGNNSFSGGDDNTASGLNSFAFGSNNTANGEHSFIIGDGGAGGGLAVSDSSFVSGVQNKAFSFGLSVFGTFAKTTYGQNYTSIVPTNELFKVGNGTGAYSRSDALVLYKNAVQKWGSISAADASALTPQDGMIFYVNSTDGTFTSIGFWARENGSWVKL